MRTVTLSTGPARILPLPLPTLVDVRHLQGQRASDGDDEGSFRDNNQLNSFMSQRSKRAMGRQASLVRRSAVP
jgi:hypothetical protein